MQRSNAATQRAGWQKLADSLLEECSEHVTGGDSSTRCRRVSQSFACNSVQDVLRSQRKLEVRETNHRRPAPIGVMRHIDAKRLIRHGTDAQSQQHDTRLGRRSKAGFTIVELLVVFAIVGLLAAILLVAVQQSRETARRMACQSHLRQIGLAVANYEQTYQYLPPGLGPGGYSVHFRLLPYLEGGDLYDRYDISKDYDDPPNATILQHGMVVFKCPSNLPSTSAIVPEYTSYVASAGGGNPVNENGMFVNLRKYGVIRTAHITDGTSQTLAVTETVAHPYSPPGTTLNGRGVILRTSTQYSIPLQLEALVNDCVSNSPTPTHRSLGRQWIEGSVGGTRFIHILPPNSPSCQNGSLLYQAIYAPSSNHPGGVNALFGDGAVRFVSNRVSRVIWLGLGTRDGGEITEPY